MALAVKEWLVPVSAAGVNVHVPVDVAVVVPSDVSPSKTCTVLPASAVPVRVGVVSLV